MIGSLKGTAGQIKEEVKNGLFHQGLTGWTKAPVWSLEKNVIGDLSGLTCSGGGVGTFAQTLTNVNLTDTYVLRFTVTGLDEARDLTASLGATDLPTVNANGVYEQEGKFTTTKALQFTPGLLFDGSVSMISVKKKR